MKEEFNPIADMRSANLKMYHLNLIQRDGTRLSKEQQEAYDKASDEYTRARDLLLARD